MKKLILGGLASAALMAGTSHAAVAIFLNDKSSFDAAASAILLSSINFDAMTTGTDIEGQTFAGVTFSSPDGNSLDVAAAADTFTPGSATNSLIATSGANILSPGGVELVPGSNLAERDSLELTFATAVQAISFDILLQSYDLAPYVNVAAYAADGSRIVYQNIPGSGLNGGAPADTYFFGLLADDIGSYISRIVITESDGNASFPDSNIGFDSFRVSGFDPGSDPVPVPAVGWLVGVALAGAAGLRRKKAQ